MPKDFKGRLFELVRESDLDYRPLAAAIGISQASLSKYTRGDAEPGLGALVKLATYFKVSTDYLAGLTDVKSPSPDLQGTVDYTGLSEEAVEVLAYNRSHSKESEGSIGVYVLMAISRILTHPNFREIPHNICNAQYHNWLGTQGELLEDLMTDDERNRLTDMDDGEIDYYGYALSTPSDAALLDEYKATKAMGQIIAELCSEKQESPWITERVEERLKAYEGTRLGDTILWLKDIYQEFGGEFAKDIVESYAKKYDIAPEQLIAAVEEGLDHAET